MSNYEKICMMSKEELAEFIVSVTQEALDGEYWDTEKAVIQWLEREASK